MDKLSFLNRLHELGVRFSVGIRDGQGGKEHIASPEELILLESDPVGGMAKILGVSKTDYMGWSNEDFSVVCAGTTSTGRRCKNIIEGGHFVSAQEWAEKSGGYCYIHGG